jgi:hypothetical protein
MDSFWLAWLLLAGMGTLGVVQTVGKFRGRRPLLRSKDPNLEWMNSPTGRSLGSTVITTPLFFLGVTVASAAYKGFEINRSLGLRILLMVPVVLGCLMMVSSAVLCFLISRFKKPRALIPPQFRE